jgi:dihydrofolate synthase/folylpolyglutamate synthase
MARVAGAGLTTPDRLDRPFADPLVGRIFPPLATGVHWGLERTVRALESLGDPHRAYPTIHIGGTNGKGSVASTLAAVLSASGLKAACYTSPHLCSFRERILVDGLPLTEDEILARAEEVTDAVVRFGLTFFEAVTVLGFHAFERASADVGVIEVGLGGRLDATNVLRPEVAAVTNIAMDHADYLGDSLEKIAWEKAGIVKPGVPLLTAEAEPALLEILRDVTREVGAPFVAVDSGAVEDLEIAADRTSFALDTHAWGRLEIETPLVGRHQATNAALAIGVLEYLPDDLRPDVQAIKNGVRAVEYHGRDEIAVIDGLTWLFDVAHNTAGIRSLVDTIDRLELPRPLVALVGVLGDKDWHSMLPPLFARTDAAVLTQPPSAPSERQWSPEEAAGAVRRMTRVTVENDFERAFEQARREAGQGTVVVTGSVHTVGSALRLLRREPLVVGRECTPR